MGGCGARPGGTADGGNRGSEGAGRAVGEGTGARGMGAPSATGGLLQGSTPGAAVVELLEQNADQFTWVAAAVGSDSASGYQLATESPVMPVGGYNGSDPSPTLEQFQQYIADGKIHFFIGSGGTGGMNAEGTATAISTWVSENFTATTVDGVTLYDLTAWRSALPPGASAVPTPQVAHAASRIIAGP